MQTLIQREYLLFNSEFESFHCSTAVPDQAGDGTTWNDRNFFIEYFFLYI